MPLRPGQPSPAELASILGVPGSRHQAPAGISPRGAVGVTGPIHGKSIRVGYSTHPRGRQARLHRR